MLIVLTKKGIKLNYPHFHSRLWDTASDTFKVLVQLYHLTFHRNSFLDDPVDGGCCIQMGVISIYPWDTLLAQAALVIDSLHFKAFTVLANVGNCCS